MQLREIFDVGLTIELRLKLNKVLILYPCIMHTLRDWTPLLLLLLRSTAATFLQILPLNLYLSKGSYCIILALSVVLRARIIKLFLTGPF